ncbi:hypothetical protein HQN90_08970 [Paenibacillus alba]|uniref:hypothetical protein n=1 Tax=Paenibacillus alba TaxID=1197127 RepID=UPI001564C668|nr:hypothetical protein [Paenibacillus alba]NQX66256.1 hypothetical protein [Paenibacillus alba]
MLRRQSKADFFEKIFESLSSDADLQDVSLDSTSCKAHQHAAGAEKGLKTPKPTKKSGFPVVDEIPKSTP